MIDYNVKYAMHLDNEKVLPEKTSECLIELSKYAIKYFKQKHDFMTFYSVLQREAEDKKDKLRIRISEHLLHDNSLARDYKKKIKLDCNKINIKLKKYGNCLDDNIVSSFEAGITLGDYMSNIEIQEISYGVEAKYVHHGKILMPSIFVEARTINEEEQHCHSVCIGLKKIVDEFYNTKGCVMYENKETHLDLMK